MYPCNNGVRINNVELIKTRDLEKFSVAPEKNDIGAVGIPSDKAISPTAQYSWADQVW